MITKIEVDGFKSLKDFSLDLKKGINILVGPNGAGKTNIILFFEFLSNLTSNQIGSAISQLGGAGSIFRKSGSNSYSETIKCKIYGSSQVNKKSFVAYEYFFQINISFEKDDVFYSNQEIKIRKAESFFDSANIPEYSGSWDLHISYKNNQDNKEEIKVFAFDKSKFDVGFSIFKGSDSKKNNEELKKFILNQMPMYNSMIRFLFGLTDDMYYLIIDLRGGETFNIVPSKIREVEDAATPPGIKKDGSGLATSLYAMKVNKKIKFNNSKNLGYYYKESLKTYNPETLERIISFLKLANSTITGLDVDNDQFSNKLIVKVSIATGSYNVVLPLSAMSDGTIKWLTLITAILTSKTIFSIEEPENFLHPWMQAEIANIMRNHLSEKKSRSFVLMTTHSESLLNNAEPEEIIVVNFIDGRTKAKRINNIVEIKREISNSGFGLGHFYFSDVLNHE